MSKENLISASRIRDLLDYEPCTGIFRWKTRQASDFRDSKYPANRECARWNGRYAGTVAGTISEVGYVTIKIDAVAFMAHRIAWLFLTGSWPEAAVDHKNMNKADNRAENLRAATASQNKANTGLQRNNRSGEKGVWLDKRSGRWRSKIGYDGQIENLGTFGNIDEAAAAYRKAAAAIYGEFARRQ